MVGLVAATIRLTTCTGYRTPWMFLLRLAIPTAAAVGTLLLAAQWMHELIAATIAAGVYVVVTLWAGPVHLRDVREVLRKEASDG